ncbi:AraC family transcriptional regulator ligand-binding domain-containing protein [Algiphilus sp.]
MTRPIETQNPRADDYWQDIDLKVVCRLTGFSRAEFLEKAGMSEQDFLTGDHKQINRSLWETAEKLTGLPYIGLEILHELNLGDYRDLGLATITAKDLRAAIQDLVTLSGLFTESWHFRFVDHSQHPAVIIEEQESPFRFTHHSMDSTVAVGIFLARTLLGKSGYDIYRANFKHSGFGAEAQYEARLACACRFDQPHYSVEFSAESLCHPMPLCNPQLHEHLVTQLQPHVQQDDLREKIRVAIHGLIKQRVWPNRQRVASVVHLGERTLLRELKKKETTFREIQEHVLEKEARRLLMAGYCADKVAEHLCYSSSSPLARMIRKRTGKTLSDLRTSLADH